MKETPEQRDIRIETEIAQFAVKQFVEKLREWCEQTHPTVGRKREVACYAFELMDYAQSLLPKEPK